MFIMNDAEKLVLEIVKEEQPISFMSLEMAILPRTKSYSDEQQADLMQYITLKELKKSY